MYDRGIFPGKSEANRAVSLSILSSWFFWADIVFIFFSDPTSLNLIFLSFFLLHLPVLSIEINLFEVRFFLANIEQ